MTLADQIADAKRALHLLMTGRLAVKTVIEGQEVEFNKASIPALRAYIRELEAAEASASGVVGRGAIGFVL